jgi:hypothetical protein
MEGRSQRNKERFQVHREFESSRIEQAMLAEAYRRILPDNCLNLVERNNTLLDRCNGESQPALQELTKLRPNYVTAIGGH